MSRCLEVTHLRKSYRGDWLVGETHALRDVSFTVEAGQTVGLLGPNGAGKTTTFKCLAGLVRPSGGAAQVFGRPAGSLAARRRLGFLAESSDFPDFLTGEEVVDLAACLAGVPRAERRARVAEVLDGVGLGAARRRRLRGYSKGMRQRVGIAQALVGRPSLVILDEPMTGLDPVGRREVRDLVGTLPAEGTTVVFSTHVLQDVEATCDHVVILAGGRVIRQGTLEALVGGREGPVEITARGLEPAAADQAAEGLPARRMAAVSGRVVLRAENPEAAELLRRALVARGGQVLSMAPLAGTLEEVFLSELAAAEPARSAPGAGRP